MYGRQNIADATGKRTLPEKEKRDIGPEAGSEVKEFFSGQVKRPEAI